MFGGQRSQPNPLNPTLPCLEGGNPHPAGSNLVMCVLLALDSGCLCGPTLVADLP